MFKTVQSKIYAIFSIAALAIGAAGLAVLLQTQGAISTLQTDELQRIEAVQAAVADINAAQFGYPDLEAHKDIHRRFVAKVSEFNKKIHSDERVSASDIITFLRDWLISHIQRKDRDNYGPHIVSARKPHNQSHAHQPQQWG